MKIVYQIFAGRGAVLLLTAALLLSLAACGGESGVEEAPAEPLEIDGLRLECSAPYGSGEFPAAARAFAAVLQSTLAEQGIVAETLTVSFSRADAATAQALSEGGVTLALLSPLAALREGISPLILLGREAEGDAAVFAAADSAYGAQLASRVAGGGTITATEWSRAVFGAVEDDALALTAADYALSESAGIDLDALAAWRFYESEDALLSAAERGEIDAALLRRSAAAERTVLLTTVPLYETALAASPTAALPETALTAAFAAAMETAEGQELLRQYGCGAWASAEKETVETLRRLAEWEDMQ